MKEHTETNRLIAGSNCYFNYDNLREHKHMDPLNQQSLANELHSVGVPLSTGTLELKSSAKKKKKKKKIKGQTEAHADATGASAPHSTGAKLSVNDVSFVDPSADYPESRLIKVGPNGDLIVESLDDEYTRQPDINHTKIMVPPVLSIPRKLALKVLAFDEEQQKFWDGLSMEEQKEIFTIDSSAIAESVHQQQKNLAARNIQADGGPGHEHLWSQNSHSKCYCTHCERNDLHILNIIDEGFDTYMEELMEGLWEQFELQYHDLSPNTKFVDVTCAESVLHDEYIEAQNVQRFEEIKQIETAGANAGEMLSTVRNLELFYYIENIIIPMIQREFTTQALTTRLSAEDRRAQFDTLSCVHQILRLIQGRNDRNRLLRDTQGDNLHPLGSKEFQRMAVADNLIDCLYSFLKEGQPGISKAMEFVKILSSVGRAGNIQLPDVTEQMSQFADMFESDDQEFIDLVAKWKASGPSEHAEGAFEEQEDDADLEERHYALKTPFSRCKCDFHNQLSHQYTPTRAKSLARKYDVDCQQHLAQQDEEVDGDNFDDNHGCEHNHYSSEHEEEGIEDALEDPETDEEIAEERRFKELRGFFFMEARKIIMKRFKESYNKRVSEDRTKKFIEELEAEENAKKEKELRKLKQKEKQKEKKRLQQLEREEKRKQKEVEEQEKAALLKRKQEELRAEQKRREDELRQKKEQEKLKKIDAIKQKEQSILSGSKHTESAALEGDFSVKKNVSVSPISERKRKEQGKEKQNKSPQESSDILVSERLHDRPVTLNAVAPGVLAAMNNASFTSIEPPSSMSIPVGATVSNKQAISPVNLFRRPSGIDPQQPLPAINEHAKQNDEIQPISFLQPKNHLLEQLYHARPTTVSATSADSINFFNEPTSGSRMGTGYSPSKKSVLAYQSDTWNAGNPSSFSTDSMVPPSFERPQFFGHTNGAAHTWSARNSQDAFTTPLLPSPMMSGLPSTSMWNEKYPRGNSIWGTSGQVNQEVHASSLWGTQTPQAGSYKAGSYSKFDTELVQSAAFKAIQEVEAIQKVGGDQDTNNVSSPAIKIFQAVKTILNNPSLKMSDFLQALHSGTKYQFKIVYDDFGSVTDINASIQLERVFGASSTTNRTPSPQQTHIPPVFHSQPAFNQLENGHKYPGFVPSPLPVNQGLGQQPLQPGLHQDLGTASSGPFQTPLAMCSPFVQTPGSSTLQIPNTEPIRYQQGAYGRSGEDANLFDSNISGTMQGSLNQLGIAQVRSGIW